ncbi:MAG: hypothetical protein ABL883_06770, partial [Terricaulis sp.]
MKILRILSFASTCRRSTLRATLSPNRTSSIPLTTTIIARGYGGLVTSAYSDDRDWVTSVVTGAAPWHGRLFLGSAKLA